LPILCFIGVLFGIGGEVLVEGGASAGEVMGLFEDDVGDIVAGFADGGYFALVAGEFVV
jgi:hypothetical protein